MNTCEWCGCTYVPRRRRQVMRWCSRKCGDDASNARRRARWVALTASRGCQECGASLEGRRSDSKWCSESCASKTEARKISRRRAKLKNVYGLTEAEHEAMLVAQGRRCAICRSSDPKQPHGTWSVDHDHLTGVVRGLLCSGCNTGIGHLRDDANILRSAADYLDRFSADCPPNNMRGVG